MPLRSTFLMLLLAGLLAVPPAAGAEGIYLGSGIGLGLPTPEIEPLSKEVEHDPGFAFEAMRLRYDHDNWGVGVQWGGASGEADSRFFNDGEWTVEYFALSARYLFSPHEPVALYLEVGGGAYRYTMLNDLAEIESDPVPGLRLAAGAKFNIGRLFVATEICYHAAEFSDAEIHTDYYDSDLDLDSRVDMLVLMVKSGLQAKE